MLNSFLFVFLKRRGSKGGHILHHFIFARKYIRLLWSCGSIEQSKLIANLASIHAHIRTDINSLLHIITDWRWYFHLFQRFYHYSIDFFHRHWGSSIALSLSYHKILTAHRSFLLSGIYFIRAIFRSENVKSGTPMPFERFKWNTREMKMFPIWNKKRGRESQEFSYLNV